MRKFAANLRVLILGKKAMGSVDLNDLGNPALFRLAHSLDFKPFEKLPRLSKEQKNMIKQIWSPYFVFFPTKYHRLYLKITGKFNPLYIPEDIMFMYIDRYYSDREAAKYFDNKCYYYQLFKGIKMPRLIAMKRGGYWFNSSGEMIDENRLMQEIGKEEEIVVKKATASEGGMGVEFVCASLADESFVKNLSAREGDIVIQAPIRQHSFLSQFNADSVNTIRIISFIKDGEVNIIYPGALRFGAKGSRVDNVTLGGTAAGIESDGTLNGKAIWGDYRRCDSNEAVIAKCKGQIIPGYDDAVRLVKRAHLMVPDFKLIHWDVAVDENGQAVLVEANFSLGSSYFQFLDRSLFEDRTDEVLKEVFGNRKRLTVLL